MWIGEAKSVLQRAVSRGVFGEKEIPKHILAFLFLSSPIFITMITVTVMTTIDRRELPPPLSSYSEGILPQYWIYDFSYRSNDFYSLDTPLHSLHSCTVWFFFFRCRYDTLPPGIFDTLALWSVQECKECKGVITEIYADTAALSAFSALSNSKMRIMQVMQMFFLFITP